MTEVANKTELQNCFYYEREMPPTVEIRKLEEGLSHNKYMVYMWRCFIQFGKKAFRQAGKKLTK